MAIVKMKKIYILSYKTRLEQITDTLQKLSIMQITNIFEEQNNSELTSFLVPYTEDDKESSSCELEENILKLQYLLNYLPVHSSEEKSFIQSMVGGKTSVSFDFFEKETSYFDFKSLFEECKLEEERTNELNNEKSNILKLISTFLPWKDLKDVLIDIHDTLNTFVFFLQIPSPIYDKFENILKEETEGTFVLEKVQEEKKEIYCILLGLKSYKERIEKIFKTYSILPVKFALTNPDDTVSNAINKLSERIIEIDKNIEEIYSKKISKSIYRIKIMLLYDHYQSIKKRFAVQNNFGNTEHTVIIKGWIKENDEERLIKNLNCLTDEIFIAKKDPEPEENVPISLNNNRIFKPFETIVRLYGMPNYYEKDPTPLIAIFFAFIFGMALSDAVYGIVQVVLCYWLVKKYKFENEEADVFWMLIWCGAATIIVGAFMGSWCGDLLDRLPSS
ncbi:MAG: hypothetical protein HY934_06165, partial [Candidatus Firestonebacteria bacterium]|nr:hypothetical protein [Candidatus Firestonebacteria bacterium]